MLGLKLNHINKGAPDVAVDWVTIGSDNGGPCSVSHHFRHQCCIIMNWSLKNKLLWNFECYLVNTNCCHFQLSMCLRGAIPVIDICVKNSKNQMVCIKTLSQMGHVKYVTTNDVFIYIHYKVNWDLNTISRGYLWLHIHDLCNHVKINIVRNFLKFQ